ncbi:MULTISPECIES: PepSY domain-containing protein [unclassified Sphingobium]|uniref:PepSY domain-containing protein n=1 Tax=unclassified Sphingobium TaxID=2611147 RepID=UPI0022244B24|nr:MULTISPECIES: PepSY domain-containing protein [unclassified Sphingobium]MCW2412998.1 putative iron-regulated membrane protein [Sphingobium sp. B8D3D]MCW2414703.1 putative iron-regulated membrane protein [Sphingobium sp. B8D3A]
MRKWHRWTTVFIGLFMLFIALTGLGSHFAAMVARGSVFETEERGAPPAAQAPVATQKAGPSAGAPGAPPAAQQAAQPATQAAPNPARKLVGLFHHLHSGEFFGPVGVIISLLSGFALVFFAISGMWMYVQMFRNRLSRGRRDIFWK